MFEKENKWVIQAEFKADKLLQYLSCKAAADIGRYSSVTVYDDTILPGDYYGIAGDYMPGEAAIRKLKQLVEIRKEVSDEEYSEGGDFQEFSYLGFEQLGNDILHYINLNQKLPLIGDYIHYQTIANFTVNSLSGEVIEYNAVTGENSVSLLDTAMKELIIEASKVKFEFNINDEIISRKDGNNVYLITGNCDSMDKIDMLLSKYFSKSVYETELGRRNFLAVDGRIGYIKGPDEDWGAIEEDKSVFIQLEDTPDKKVIKAELFDEYGGGSCVIYTLEMQGSGWKITNEELLYPSP